MAIEPTAEQRIQERNSITGVRLLIAADVFIFLGFLFAYIYLRALNSNGLWRPPGVHPSGWLGGATVIALAVAAVCGVLTGRRARVNGAASGLAGLALLAVLVATVLQGIQTFNPGFSPTFAGGFGSVMVGFTACMLIHLLGASYWSETLAATLWRNGPDVELASSADAFGLFMIFLAVVMAGAFILFYLV